MSASLEGIYRMPPHICGVSKSCFRPREEPERTDPELGRIQTPHGQVEFLQVFGITEAEWRQTEGLLARTTALAEQHRQSNPFYITDLERPDG